MTNAIAIARNLADAGIDQKAAEAIAEVVVTHSDKSHATKSDIVRLDGDIKSLTLLVKLNLSLTAGLYVGLALIFVAHLLE